MSALLLALALAGPAHAGGQAQFDQGVAASRTGDPAAAAAAFDAALQAGAHDPAVYLGLGNALYRQGALGPAIAAWLRGLELSPTDGDLQANLAHARKQTQDRLALPEEHVGPFFWQAAVSPATEALLAGLMVAIGLSLQIVGLLGRRRAGQPGRPHLAGLSLALVGLVLAGTTVMHARRLPPATVLVPQVAVRSALGAEGVDLFLLHEGAVVQAVERYAGGEGGAGAAVLIELPDARKGWVPASAVDLADPVSPFPVSAPAVDP